MCLKESWLDATFVARRFTIFQTVYYAEDQNTNTFTNSKTQFFKKKFTS